MKNKNKGDGIVDIMSHLHQFVPASEHTKRVTIKSTGEEVDVHQATFHKILIGGDQLTAARARGAKKMRVNSVSGLRDLSLVQKTGILSSICFRLCPFPPNFVCVCACIHPQNILSSGSTS